MDVKVEGRRAEVQKRRVSLTIWTLERCDAQRKSKRGAEACRIVLYKILVNKYSACYNMQAYFVYTNKVIGINKIYNQGGTKDVIYERSDRELRGRLCWEG